MLEQQWLARRTRADWQVCLLECRSEWVADLVQDLGSSRRLLPESQRKHGLLEGPAIVVPVPKRSEELLGEVASGPILTSCPPAQYGGDARIFDLLG